MKLISLGNREYVTEDVRVEIALDVTFTTECDEPHPVRMRVDLLERWYTPEGLKKFLSGYDKKVTSRWSKTEQRYVSYVSWHCDGNEEHHYSQWTVKVDGDWTENVYDKFEHALHEAEVAVGEPLTLQRKQAPKPKFQTTTNEFGHALWVNCGHRAERDIDDNCYTCHGSL